MKFEKEKGKNDNASMSSHSSIIENEEKTINFNGLIESVIVDQSKVEEKANASANETVLNNQQSVLYSSEENNLSMDKFGGLLFSRRNSSLNIDHLGYQLMSDEDQDADRFLYDDFQFQK